MHALRCFTTNSKSNFCLHFFLQFFHCKKKGLSPGLLMLQYASLEVFACLLSLSLSLAVFYVVKSFVYYYYILGHCGSQYFYSFPLSDKMTDIFYGKICCLKGIWIDTQLIRLFVKSLEYLDIQISELSLNLASSLRGW